MHRSLSEAVDQAKTASVRGSSPALWPNPYREDSPEACFEFLARCCWTYNEANAAIELVPGHDYIRKLVGTWHSCRSSGRPLIIEKSRRLILSWVLRGCELWRMGLNCEKGLICGLNYPKAAEHVWRIWWLYEQVRERTDWDLSPCEPRGGNVIAQELDQVILPNGSLVQTLNQDGQSFQGSGYSWVTMEEFSLYRNPRYMWSQAIRVTEGKPGAKPGMVCVITNASPNKAWQEIKRAAPQLAMAQPCCPVGLQKQK
jgi:hypothetical protein